MTRRTLTDAERIVSIREVIEAARGDWHEATTLLSVGADLNWLLDKVAVLSEATPSPDPEVASLRAALDECRQHHADTLAGLDPHTGPDTALDVGRLARALQAWASGSVVDIGLWADATDRQRKSWRQQALALAAEYARLAAETPEPAE